MYPRQVTKHIPTWNPANVPWADNKTSCQATFLFHNQPGRDFPEQLQLCKYQTGSWWSLRVQRNWNNDFHDFVLFFYLPFTVSILIIHLFILFISYSTWYNCMVLGSMTDWLLLYKSSEFCEDNKFSLNTSYMWELKVVSKNLISWVSLSSYIAWICII